jgi:hypothetical protein
MAIPDRSVGERQSLQLQAVGLRRRNQPVCPGKNRLLQLRDRCSRRRRARAGRRSSTCRQSPVLGSRAGPAGRRRSHARPQPPIPDHRFIRLADIRSRAGAQRPLRRDRGDRDRQRPSADIGGGCGHPILEWRCDSAMGRHGARPVAGDPRAAFPLTTCLRGEEGASAHSVFHGTALRSISWNTTEVISPRMPMVTIPTNMMSTCSSSQEFQIR